MVRVDKISKPKLLELIRHSYEGDKDLCEKYHAIKGDEEMLSLETMDMIENASKQLDLTYYKVLFHNNPIGYFAISDQLLYSFAINKRFRKKEILMSWWASVKEVLGKAFTTCLYINNTRAIKFLEKNGMQIHKTDGNLITLINYN